jgi:hypothetical protein
VLQAAEYALVQFAARRAAQKEAEDYWAKLTPANKKKAPVPGPPRTSAEDVDGSMSGLEKLGLYAWLMRHHVRDTALLIDDLKYGSERTVLSATHCLLATTSSMEKK